MMMRAFCGLTDRHQWSETRAGFFGADVRAGGYRRLPGHQVDRNRGLSLTAIALQWV